MKDVWDRDNHNHANQTIVKIFFKQPSLYYVPRAYEQYVIAREEGEIHGKEWLWNELRISELFNISSPYGVKDKN